MRLAIDDVSAFIKALRLALKEPVASAKVPTHVQLMNVVAKAAGHANVQALKASQSMLASQATQDASASRPVDSTKLVARSHHAGSVQPEPLSAMAAKAAMQFDAQGRLVRWPTKFSVQRLAMWVLWMRFDAKKRYSEREVNEVLKAWHLFGDHATLRRELINMRLLARKSDCSAYWKEPARPDNETKALMSLVRQRGRDD